MTIYRIQIKGTEKTYPAVERNRNYFSIMDDEKQVNFYVPKTDVVVLEKGVEA